MGNILQVDVAGTPQEWISPAQAATIICSGNMSWSTGSIVTTLQY